MRYSLVSHRFAVVLFSLIFFVSGLFAQKRVLGKPDNFESPIDYFDSPANYDKFIQTDTRSKSSDNAWLVISDRESNTVYEKPNTSSATVATLGFQEYCYVVSEEKDWIEVIDASVDKLKIINVKRKLGWIPKKNILLWNSGVVQSGTKIHRKVLLLNRADDVENILKLKKQEFVEMYKGPTTATKLPDRKIFDYYFVMKKDGSRLLLCEEDNVSAFNVDKIIGWVDERRCAKWDNRICLEPNYTAAGYEERKANAKFQVRAFENEAASKAYAEQFVENKNDIFWKDDPVMVKRDKMSKTNPYRYQGSVIRFPLLAKTDNAPAQSQIEGCCFRSGIIGTIKTRKDGSSTMGFDSEIAEMNYGVLSSQVADMNKKTGNVNIFFVIEGTDSTFAYKNYLLQSINAINTELGTGIPNLQYGALIYRDIPEEKARVNGQVTNRLTEFVALTQDFDKVIGFIERAEFRNYEDRDDPTALFYGVSQALTQAGFRDEELNILLLIGNYGDYRVDKDRKAAAIKSKHKTLYEDLTPIVENLSAREVHLYAVQLHNDGNKISNSFSKQAQVLILESAKYAYNKYYGNRSDPQTQELLNKLSKDHQIDISEPTMADIFEGDDIPLLGGRYPGRLIKPAANRYLTPAQLAAALKNDVKESLDFTKMLKMIVSSVYGVGNGLSAAEIESELKGDAGRWAPALASMLNKKMEEHTVSSKDLYNSLDVKYKLYTEVYIPKQYQGAQNPTMSFALFMPETELMEYKRSIDRLISDDVSSYSKRREKMYDTYKELITQFSGETGLRTIDNFTRDQVAQLMQGIYGSGLKLNVQLDVRIGDLRDEKKVSNEQIDALMKRFKEVQTNLSDALRKAEGYDFCYVSEAGNRYYWIAIEDAF